MLSYLAWQIVEIGNLVTYSFSYQVKPEVTDVLGYLIVSSNSVSPFR